MYACAREHNSGGDGCDWRLFLARRYVLHIDTQCSYSSVFATDNICRARRQAGFAETTGDAVQPDL
jgi:hypothetical protein